MNSSLGFNGERRDPINGCYHLGNGYRAYNPGLMRFNCPDNLSPFGAGRINPYVYCAGDPVNSADPSGHISWQAGLGIGLGILGILGAVFIGGASIAAAGSLSAALAGASTASLIVGASALVADITGIASAATEQRNPRASARLGWVSFAAGILSMGLGLYNSLRRAVKPTPKYRIQRMGKNAADTKVLGDNASDMSPVFIFTDLYRQKKRFNIVAHGIYDDSVGGGVISIKIKNEVVNFTGRSFANYLESIGIDFSKYNYARTIVCDSANGGYNSFGQGFAIRTALKTKSFEGAVWDISELKKNVGLWRNVNRMDPLTFNNETLNIYLEYSLHGMSDKKVMRVVKDPPYNWKPRAFSPNLSLDDAYYLKSRR